MTIEEAIVRYHFLKIGDDGVVEMYLDNHALSTFRSCEGKFELQIMASIHSKHRAWSLEFGIIWHKMMEVFYTKRNDETFDYKKWLEYAAEIWIWNRMDEFSEHYAHKALGGVYGFVALCGQYASFFAANNDRLRVIGIEIPFGKKKEVPLGEFQTYMFSTNDIIQHYSYAVPVRCYLTGRIDFMMDNGSYLGPMDHKSASDFQSKNKANDYDPQDGMTGYVFATREIVKTRFPELMTGRKIGMIWMNFAQIKPEPVASNRFKRSPIFKTDFQLEEYRLRQLRTFHKIYDMIILGEKSDWNTYDCKLFNSNCSYRNLHTQNSQSNMLTVLNQDYVVKEPWDPEKTRELE